MECLHHWANYHLRPRTDRLCHVWLAQTWNQRIRTTGDWTSRDNVPSLGGALRSRFKLHLHHSAKALSATSRVTGWCVCTVLSFLWTIIVMSKRTMIFYFQFRSDFPPFRLFFNVFRARQHTSLERCYRPSVYHITRVDQSNTVKVKIMQFSPYSNPVPPVCEG